MERLPHDRLRYTPKDYHRVTGYAIGKCREELEKMRQQNNLKEHELLTVFHVSASTGIPVEELLRRMH